MDYNQKFILDKMRDGLASKHISQPMTSEDLDRLQWCGDDYTKIPTEEWNEWSRKTHWALQVAFSQDTSKLQNKDKVNEWRSRCVAVVKNAFQKDPSDRIILESAALHFLEKDLLNHIINVFGYKNLTEEEQKMIEMFSGAAKFSTRKDCLGTIFFAFIFSEILSVIIFLVFK